MSDEEIRTIDADFKRSELHWRSDIENDVKELVRLERERALKYDHFIDILIKRESDREELRLAIMKHGTIFVLGAVALFVLRACWNEFTQVISVLGKTNH